LVTSERGTPAIDVESLAAHVDYNGVFSKWSSDQFAAKIPRFAMEGRPRLCSPAMIRLNSGLIQESRRNSAG
jgi:hypothetical protein